jgi:transcriptional repressor NrdR
VVILLKALKFHTMLCPKCSSIDDKVIDSRLSKDGSSIRRRRECLSCESRFTTYEQIERVEMLAVKRDGRREPFDRQKLLSSFIKACEKRPIPLETMEEAVQSIILDLESGQEREVSSRLIGAKVMERLHAMDPVAYVRFASVYRRFEDIGEFIEEIQSLERRSPASDDQKELFQKVP